MEQILIRQIYISLEASEKKAIASVAYLKVMKAVDYLMLALC